MAYERVNWENEPSKNTPISAENLNKMDEGIAEAHKDLSNKLSKSGWEANKILGTDAEGNVVAKEEPKDTGKKIDEHNESETAHQDIRDEIEEISGEIEKINETLGNLPSGGGSSDTENTDSFTVIDNLKSTDTANPLSANQGKVLNDNMDMIREAEGEYITLQDPAESPFKSLTIYGKSTQADIPTPDNPQEIVDVGDTGSVIVSVITGKNLLQYPYRDGYLNSEKTENGITFTVNDDGTITVNGAATADTSFWICNLSGVIFSSYDKSIVLYLNNGPYMVSGCPSGGSESTYHMRLQDNNGDVYTDTGNGIVIDNKDNIAICAYDIQIASGTVCDNLVFKPQVECGTSITEYTKPSDTQQTHIYLTDPLRGIPVETGGNYADSTGQQYIADTLELKNDGSGIITRMIGKLTNVVWEILPAGDGVDNDVLYIIKETGTDAIHTEQSPIVSNMFTGIVSPDELDYYVGATDDSTLMATVEKGKYATVEEATEGLKDAIFYYRLMTPYTETLSPDEVKKFLALHSSSPTTELTNYERAYQKVEYTVNTSLYRDIKDIILMETGGTAEADEGSGGDDVPSDDGGSSATTWSKLQNKPFGDVLKTVRITNATVIEEIPAIESVKVSECPSIYELGLARIPAADSEGNIDTSTVWKIYPQILDKDFLNNAGLISTDFSLYDAVIIDYGYMIGSTADMLFTIVTITDGTLGDVYIPPVYISPTGGTIEGITFPAGILFYMDAGDDFYLEYDIYSKIPRKMLPDNIASASTESVDVTDVQVGNVHIYNIGSGTFDATTFDMSGYAVGDIVFVVGDIATGDEATT